MFVYAKQKYKNHINFKILNKPTEAGKTSFEFTPTAGNKKTIHPNDGKHLLNYLKGQVNSS